jgi:hypothetical protein
MEIANAIEKDSQNAEKDEDEKDEVEKAAGKGVVAKDDDVPLVAPRSTR